MQKKIIAPRVREGTAEWYKDHFANTNAGVVFMLESLPELYKRAMLEIKGKFSHGELLLIVDVYNDVYNATILTPGMPMLDAQVSDGIALDHLDGKWEVDGEILIEKIADLTSYQKAVLEIWANGYWYAQPGKELRDLEKYVRGLL